MTFRERYWAVAHFQRPDVVPILTCSSINGPNMETVRTWQREQGFPEWVQTLEDWDTFWGTSRLRYWSPGSTEPPMPPPDVIADDGEYHTLRYANGSVVREMHDNWDRYTMPEFIEYPLKHLDEWPAYRDRWLPLDDGVYPDDWPQQAKELSARDYPLGVGMAGSFSVLRGLFGTALACTAFYDAPDTVRDILRQYREMAMRRNRRFLSDVKVDFAHTGEDYCYRNGCFVSPRIYREFIVPHYREQADYLRSLGVDVLGIDSDGYVEDVIGLIEESGWNYLEAFEPRAGNDVRRVRESHPTFIIRGGLDKFAMDHSDFGEVDRLMDEIAAPMLEAGGYFPGIDHGLPPTTKFRTYLHFMDRLHELCNNPAGRFREYL